MNSIIKFLVLLLLIMVCSICGKSSHNKNNKKFHSKNDLEIHHNSILSKKLVNNIFKNIMYNSCNMDPLQLSTKESQAHGKTIENDVKIEIYGVDKAYPHTSIHDINAYDNNINKKNVSVKSTGVDKKIDCADILRFLDLENTEIVVAYYIQDEEYKVINKTYLLDHKTFLDKLKKDVLSLGHNSYEDWIENVKNYVDDVNNIPSGSVDNKWYKINKPSTPSYFNISPKVDTKNQRRVQCTITDFTDFIVQENNGSILHGKEYNGRVMCGRRIRHPKNT